MTTSLRITAKAVRSRSVVYSIGGAILTGIVTSLPLLISTPEFKEVLYQWLATNPVLAGFVLVGLTILVTEIMKALRNAGVIKRVEEEGDTLRTSSEERGAVLI